MGVIGAAIKAVVLVGLLAVPVWVIVEGLPMFVSYTSELIELAPSRTITRTVDRPRSGAGSEPTFKRVEPDPGPPPTLVPPGWAPTPPPEQADPAADPTPTPAAQERVVVGSTGGRGLVLRATPGTGASVAALRDGQPLEVLAHQTAGTQEWLRVRTAQGAEGWVAGWLVEPARAQ